MLGMYLVCFKPVMEACLRSFEKVDEPLRYMVARGLSVNIHVYNNIVDVQYPYGCALKPQDVIRKMIEEGCEPGLVTYI